MGSLKPAQKVSDQIAFHIFWSISEEPGSFWRSITINCMSVKILIAHFFGVTAESCGEDFFESPGLMNIPPEPQAHNVFGHQKPWRSAS